MKALYKTFTWLLIMTTCNTKTFSQSCTDTFTDTVSSITCSPFQTAFLSNGNMVVANYRGDNGNQILTVDLFNVAQCEWTKSYTCPDVGLPDSKLQLLVADNDFISVKYKGNSYSNIIQLNKNLVEQQRFQPNNNAYTQMQMALDKSGNNIISRKKYNPSFGRFDIEFQKFAQNNFNSLWYFSRTNVPNVSINTIDAITTDNNRNVIVSGNAQDLNTGNLFLYTCKFGRTGGITFFTQLNWPGTITSGTKVITDKSNNILVSVNMLNSKEVNVTFKLDPQGVQLWANENKVSAFAENNFWMTSDSNKSTYIVYNETTGNTFPSSVAVVAKYLSNGQKAWERNYKYLIAKSITTKDANSIFIGGSKYLTQKDFPSYRPYWQLINLAGDELENAYDYFNVDSSITLSYEGQFNQLVYNDDAKTLAAIGIRKHTLVNNTLTNYAFVRSFEFNTAPKIRFENVSELAIAPNPAADFITLRSHATNEILKITITTIDGKFVFEKTIIQSENKIDIHDWKSGIYLVKLITQNGVITNKFVKL